MGLQGFFQQFWEKVLGQNWEKMIDLTSKLGEINDIEYNKDSKIYTQNQVILDWRWAKNPLAYKHFYDPNMATNKKPWWISPL